MQLKGKTAIVTGSSRGLGSYCVEIGNMGANIVLNGSPASTSLDATAEEFKAAGINVVVAKGDVKTLKMLRTWLKRQWMLSEELDILVNNAGITRDTLMLKMSEKDWDDVLNTNLKSAYLCTKAVSKIMLKQKSGKIINITSIAGIIGNAVRPIMQHQKAGLIGFYKINRKGICRKGDLL